jgi:hypothetical protein
MNLLNRGALGTVARCTRAVMQAHGFGSPSPFDCSPAAIHRFQAVTIIWMIVEAFVSLSAAWMTRSPALLAFVGDLAKSIPEGVRRLRSLENPPHGTSLLPVTVLNCNSRRAVNLRNVAHALVQQVSDYIGLLTITNRKAYATANG